jgi:dTDP-4-dehydrorhamnose reductase
MKVLLFGCNGLLGQALRLSAPKDVNIEGISQEENLFGQPVVPYTQLDITNSQRLKSAIQSINPDWIFNAAAMTNVDGCETNPEACKAVNLTAVENMAALGIPMVHISTDYVFNGESGPYQEDDQPDPISVYGRLKLLSEAPVLNANSRSLIVRTMLLWGRGANLRPSFVDFVKNELEAHRSVKIVTDQIGNPTLASDLAAGIWHLVGKGHSGIYHLSGSECVSRFEWARRIAHYYKLDNTLIHSVLTRDLNQAAPRPLKSGFLLGKFTQVAGFTPKSVIEQLEAISN